MPNFILSLFLTNITLSDMLRKMYPTIRKSLLVLLLTIFCQHAFASHIVGMDLFYTWVVGNTYKITLVVYGSCGLPSRAAFGTLSGGTPQICIFQDTVFVGSTTLSVVAPDSGLLINQICTAYADSTECSNTASTIPGIKKFVYETTYPLPSATAGIPWHFTFTGGFGTASAGGRAAAITNIASPSTTVTALTATIADPALHNSSAELLDVTNYYFAVNRDEYYTPAGIDADGDSTVYSLVAAANPPVVGGCGRVDTVAYLTGLSPTSPLNASTFSFDGATGQMNFRTSVVQRAVVVYNIKEYRAGVFTGSSQREMTVLVLPGGSLGTFSRPFAGFDSATAGRIIDTTHLEVCTRTGSFTAYLHPREADTTQQITVTPFGLPPGATVTTIDNNTNHPQTSFTWSTTGVAPGTYSFYVSYNDSACPIMAINTIAYEIKVLATGICSSATPSIASQSQSFELYPNPTNGDITVTYPEQYVGATFVIEDMLGRTIAMQTTDNIPGKTQIHIESMPAGVYYVRLSGSITCQRMQFVKL